MMHLDTVMTMVDTDTFVLYPYFDRALRSWTIQPGDDPTELQVTRNDDFWADARRGRSRSTRSPC